VTYPENNNTADRLKVLAGLIAQPLGIRMATVDADGEFDTHEGQAQTLDRDLGAGGVAWVQGPRALGGVLTEYPSLIDLDRQKNLKVTVDFRRVYSSLLAQWMGTDPAEVIPGAGQFGQVALVRS
jgi:uncharacterized protein (DUF1501 family)